MTLSPFIDRLLDAKPYLNGFACIQGGHSDILSVR